MPPLMLADATRFRCHAAAKSHHAYRRGRSSISMPLMSRYFSSLEQLLPMPLALSPEEYTAGEKMATEDTVIFRV